MDSLLRDFMRDLRLLQTLKILKLSEFKILVEKKRERERVKDQILFSKNHQAYMVWMV